MFLKRGIKFTLILCTFLPMPSTENRKHQKNRAYKLSVPSVDWVFSPEIEMFIAAGLTIVINFTMCHSKSQVYFWNFLFLEFSASGVTSTDLRKSNRRESVLPSLNDLRDRKDFLLLTRRSVIMSQLVHDPLKRRIFLKPSHNADNFADDRHPLIDQDGMVLGVGRH